MARGTVRMDGRLLRQARLRLGWSAERLALEACGAVTRQQVREYEQGLRSPDPASFVRMVRALGVEPAQIAGAGVVRLADLRHWAGLTAEQAAGAFGFSRWSLLRAEATGRLPQTVGREIFVADAAVLYGCPERLVAAALRWAARPKAATGSSPVGVSSLNA